MTLMFRHSFIIPQSDLEPGYNHLNHARALYYLEEARLKYLVEIGCSNESFLAEDIFLVIASIQIRYKREIFSGSYTATVSEIRTEGKSLLMKQFLYNDREKECVEAEFDTRFVDGKLKRSIQIPKRFIDSYTAASKRT